MLKMGSLRRPVSDPPPLLLPLLPPIRLLGDERRKTVSLSVRWSGLWPLGRTGSERGLTVATGGEEMTLVGVMTGLTSGAGGSTLSAGLLVVVLPTGLERIPPEADEVTSRFSTMRLTEPFLSTRVATARGFRSPPTRPAGTELDSSVDKERRRIRGRTAVVRSAVKAEAAEEAEGGTRIAAGGPIFSRSIRFSSSTFSIEASASNLKSFATRTVVKRSFWNCCHSSCWASHLARSSTSIRSTSSRLARASARRTW